MTKLTNSNINIETQSIRRVIFILAFLSALLDADNVFAHGEQVAIFIFSWGGLILASIIVIFFIKLLKQYRGTLISIFILFTILLMVIPSAKTLPPSVVKFIEYLIWDYPVIAAFIFFSVSLIPGIIFLFIKRGKNTKK